MHDSSRVMGWFSFPTFLMLTTCPCLRCIERLFVGLPCFGISDRLPELDAQTRTILSLKRR